jgi:uncharacterized membrane protein
MMGDTFRLALLPLGLMGLLISAVQMICLVLLILLAINSYKMQVLEIPVVTQWLKKYVN